MSETMRDTEADPILKPGDQAGREARHDAAEDKALDILDAIHGLVTGRKVIALQHLERPVEARDNPGLGQWDTYVRVLDADDEADSEEPEAQA